MRVLLGRRSPGFLVMHFRLGPLGGAGASWEADNAEDAFERIWPRPPADPCTRQGSGHAPPGHWPAGFPAAAWRHPCGPALLREAPGEAGVEPGPSSPIAP